MMRHHDGAMLQGSRAMRPGEASSCLRARPEVPTRAPVQIAADLLSACDGLFVFDQLRRGAFAGRMGCSAGLDRGFAWTRRHSWEVGWGGQQ